jgi:hypothetical protein
MCLIAPPVPGIDEVILELIDILFPPEPERADPVLPLIPGA